MVEKFKKRSFYLFNTEYEYVSHPIQKFYQLTTSNLHLFYYCTHSLYAARSDRIDVTDDEAHLVTKMTDLWEYMLRVFGKEAPYHYYPGPVFLTVRVANIKNTKTLYS